MKRLLHSLLFVVLAFAAQAQDFLGYSNSNYAGVSGIDLQPASIVDSRYKFDASLFGFSLNFANNFVGIDRSAFKYDKNYIDSAGFWPFQHMRAFSDPDFQNKYLKQRVNDKNKSVYLSNQIVLPSFMVTLNRQSAIAFNWRIRTYVNVDGVEPELANLIYSGLKDSIYWQKTFKNEDFSIQTMTWAEYGATYGRVFKDDGEHFLKGAGRLKFLQGLQAAYMFVRELEYDFTNDDTLSLFNSDVSYGHSSNFEFDQGQMKYKLVSKPSFGLDLGFVYEWRPDHKEYKYDLDGETNLWYRDKNKYKLKVGFSAVDIGAIKFEKGEGSRNFNADIRDWNLDSLDFGGVNDFDDTLRKRFVFTEDRGIFHMNLPTAFSLQVDYNIWKGFYANLTGYYALQFKKNEHKTHDISTISIAPRWESKWFGVFVPVSYNSYRNTMLGLDLRIGPLIVGTQNIGSLLGTTDMFSADFHFLLKVPIMYKKIRDKDKDKVSDAKDKCKDVPGVWEFMGCPDRDGDHIEDKVDVCPDEPGVPEFNGCPDRDGDKIMDKQDACPDIPGLAEFNGCPDKDGDKIPDKDDDCPEEAGLEIYKGCPDTDKDSIIDKLDRCPDKPGPRENKGCPQTKLHLLDGQGNIIKTAVMTNDKVFVFEALPMGDAIVFKLEGEDTDMLNVVTVIVNGMAKKAVRGNDRLFRFEKLAGDDLKLKPMDVPDVPIQLQKEEEEILKKAFSNLEFETGKDIIKKESYAALDELAELMKKKPTWKLKLSGHTDNQGAPAANLKLSEKRAKAVKNYLMKKGIKEDRFKVEWFGQTKPIADNKTPEGRQKNRRVEMKIIE
jgi:outer membrane protein OmpA-like peptidoglycan-associated protein